MTSGGRVRVGLGVPSLTLILLTLCLTLCALPAGAAGLSFAVLEWLAPQIVGTYLSGASDALVASTVTAFRQYSVAYLLMGFNVVIGGYMTALEQPMPAICISTGRGLIVQAAVLMVLAAATNGAGIWLTPIFSEGLVLCMAVFFLKNKNNLQIVQGV